MQCITFDDLVSSPDKKFLKLFTPSFTSVEDQEEDPTTQDRQCIIYHLKYLVLRNLPSNSHGSHPPLFILRYQTDKSGLTHCFQKDIICKANTKLCAMRAHVHLSAATTLFRRAAAWDL